ncbi:MAG: dihydrodipicolinate synthase family protein [Saprospiraceae bacterium]|nr:dihydrodipicolinate synthase family protein [Saprospiraceae bacterium]
MTVNWEGVYPAVTTKFTTDDALDFDAIALNFQAQIDAGVHALILGGSLGEASTLDDDEKFELLRFSLDFIKGQIPIVLNITEGATRRAVSYVKKAEQMGVDGFMALPPMRYKSDDRETIHFFKAIADATSKPIMIYNNPVDYKIEVTIPMFEQLLKEHQNIEAVKDSTRDVTNVTRLRNAFGDRLKIMGGVDTLTMESLVMGADGLVAGLVCAFPRETVVLYHLVKQGRIAEAVSLYRWFLPLLELDIHPKLVQYIKLAEQYTGIGTEQVRAPRLPLVGKERETVVAIIEKGLKSRPILPNI